MTGPAALSPLPLAHFLFKGAPLLVFIGAIFAALTGVLGVNFIKPAGWKAQLWVALLMLMGLGVAVAGWIQGAAGLQDAELQARIAAKDHATSQKSIGDLRAKIDKLLKPPPSSNVSLCLVNRGRPALVLVNTTDQVAATVRYSYGLFDLDSETPDIPLRILTETADFIKPRLWAGPMDIFNSMTAGGPAVKDGDRIVGSIAVSCPMCAVGHTYLVSLVLGKGGWYSPVKSLNGVIGGEVVAPLRRDPHGPFFEARDFLALLATVPRSERMKIVNQRTYLVAGKTAGDCETDR
jgi:hypothetical protein